MFKGYVSATLVIFNNYLIKDIFFNGFSVSMICLLYTSPSPRD